MQSAASPAGSYCSLSPSCNPFSPTFSLSSPPAATTATSTSRSNSTLIFHTVMSSSSLSSLNINNQFSPNSSSNDTISSPKYNWSNSNDEYQTNTIQFSPSIKNDSEDEQIDDEEDQPIQIKIATEQQTEEPKQTLVSNQQSIETINRTEGCVFYVLSQLSHGDKPSIYLFNNFESITICLLNYLKNATVRNPRALRILNRLTKNHYCFTFFIQTQFPYKIKRILFDELEANSPLLKKKDEDIEKEMNVYLNSNKVFFDAHSSFPSFESIEFTLINNLKSQCISSSDHGYLTLIQMIKLTQKRTERLACALVAPFILRNSKALHYIMIQLSGIDLVIDLLLDDSDAMKLKTVLCIRKILTFVNYKRDVKKVKEFFENTRLKLQETSVVESRECVKFQFNEDLISANKEILSKRSEYFNALLNGQFMESNNEQTIEIKDISYEAFKIVIDLIQINIDLINCDLTFELCYELVLVCDRFMLNDLKDLFISLLINQFLNMSTFVLVFKLAWYLNNSIMEQASIDYFLSRINSFTSNEDEELNIKSSLFENLKCVALVSFVVDSLKQNSSDCLLLKATDSVLSQERQLIDYFKKSLKSALGDIIKK